jgi:three-Cys-motif partner protein
MPDDFFDEQLPGSKLKSKIVSSYFWRWASVMKRRSQRVGYLDFFCGQGQYEDGSDSTPVLILKAAKDDPELSQKLVTIFNDKVHSNVDKLEGIVTSLRRISTLKYKPIFKKDIVGSDIVAEMRKTELIPSLIFIDPFGYKGLSLDLIASVIKDWGCDCIFFFNYNRINAALSNPVMVENVSDVFGEETATKLKREIKSMNPQQREHHILKYFENELKKVKGEFSIKFKFYQKQKNKTSHYLYFVSKHELGYKLMKDIMAGCCSRKGGIPTYEYRPDETFEKKQDTISGAIQTDLFGGIPVDEDSGIRTLAKELSKVFQGRQVNITTVFQEHNIGTPYIEECYKKALLYLEKEGKVVCEPSFSKRRLHKGMPTLGESVTIKF